MNTHQRIYLENSSLSEVEFKKLIRMGFEVHHIDSDHYNNDPENLVLVHKDDHEKKLHKVEKGGKGKYLPLIPSKRVVKAMYKDGFSIEEIIWRLWAIKPVVFRAKYRDNTPAFKEYDKVKRKVLKWLGIST